jgi:hypothetical protein
MTSPNSIEVVIAGHLYMVKKFTVQMDIRRAMLQALINATVHSENIEVQPMMRIASTIYVPLASCTFPVDDSYPIPTLPEFLEMDGMEADAWSIAGRTLNPTWFYENEEINKAFVKKKEKKLTRSTRNS